MCAPSSYWSPPPPPPVAPIPLPRPAPAVALACPLPPSRRRVACRRLPRRAWRIYRTAQCRMSPPRPHCGACTRRTEEHPPPRPARASCGAGPRHVVLSSTPDDPTAPRPPLWRSASCAVTSRPARLSIDPVAASIPEHPLHIAALTTRPAAPAVGSLRMLMNFQPNLAIQEISVRALLDCPPALLRIICSFSRTLHVSFAHAPVRCYE